MKKNRVRNKIKRFYERERKAAWFKVSREILDDTRIVEMLIESKIKHLDKRPTWIKNPTVMIGETGRDFINNTKTVRIDYTYPKYGNL